MNETCFITKEEYNGYMDIVTYTVLGTVCVFVAYVDNSVNESIQRKFYF